MIHRYHEKIPRVEEAAFVAWNAEVCGDVVLEKNSSVWYSCTLRGDIEPIFIGRGANIQDNSVIHTENDSPVWIGENTVVGHGAILHGCRIGAGSLIGMGAIILNSVEIGEGCIIGAGALLTEGKKIPPRSVVLGSPAKIIRKVTDEEIESIQRNAVRYIEKAQSARAMQAEN